MKFRYSLLLLPALAVLVGLQACDVKAVNEPGVDIQNPVVAFLAPQQGDSVGAADVQVRLTASDNDNVTRIELFLNNAGTPLRVISASPWEVAIPASEIPDGNHELLARAYDPTGNASTARVALRKGQTGTIDEPRMSLVEIITSANCAPCALQNETWQHEIESPAFASRVATIRYHVWWPRPTDLLWKQSSEWSRPRTIYLFNPLPENQYAAPKAWVGGQMISQKATEWKAAAETDMEKPAGARIELTPRREGSTIQLDIKVTGISTAAYSDLRLHTVLLESDIEYNDGNAENFHFLVMRRMYPDAEGETVSLANGQIATFTRSMSIESNWNPEKLDVVVFLQSVGTKEVLQAAKAKI